MKAALIKLLIQVILTVLTQDKLREFADMVLDFVEDKVKGSSSSIDDALVLPICDQIREAFNLPDDD